MRKTILMIVIVVIGLLMGGCDDGENIEGGTVQDSQFSIVKWHDDGSNVSFSTSSTKRSCDLDEIISGGESSSR